MQSRGKLIIPLAIAFLFALNLSGLDQATPPNPGTATNPSTSQPAQSPAGSYQSGIGTTTPNSIPAQPPNNVNPGVTPNSNVIPSSTLPNQNPNLVPNPYPNTVPFSNVNPGATNPNVTPGTQPNNSSAPVGTAVPGTGSSLAIGAGAPGASPPLGCSRVQAWQCLE